MVSVPEFTNLMFMSWLAEVILQFLWVPFTVYTKDLGLGLSFAGLLFAVNVGARVIPNLLVTRLGRHVDIVMMAACLATCSASFLWPESPVALMAVSIGGGLGFTRPCVQLHLQAACSGDDFALERASGRCGSARTFADICGFVLPPLCYETFGWQGVMVLGGVTAALYILMALCQLRTQESEAVVVTQSIEDSSDVDSTDAASVDTTTCIDWVDWCISAAFVSTELQCNIWVTAAPAALIRHYAVQSSQTGAVMASASAVAMLYLMIRPSLPGAFNNVRPMNLIVTYIGMLAGWALMLMAVFFLPVQGFIAGIFVYWAMAMGSQVVLMECLSGVCDAQASAKVLGVSEVWGCLFGMLGSYLGAALLEAGVWCPFALCAAWSALSVIFLLFSLGLRTWTRETNSPDPCFQGAIGAVPLCLAGLSTIAQCKGSYVKDERAFRRTQSLGSLASSKPSGLFNVPKSQSSGALALGRSKSSAALAKSKSTLLQSLLESEGEKLISVV